MLAAIQQKQTKLKTVETKEFKGIGQDEIDVGEWYAANIETWYQHIEPCTFHTTFLSMSPEEGLLLLRANKAFLDKTKNTDEDLKSLELLEEKLDVEMKKIDKGCFVKLSCRSPKDATVLAPEMLQGFHDAVKKKLDNGKNVTENERLIELFTSHIQLLHSYTAKDALKWFIHSTRVTEDITMALEQKEEIFPIQVSHINDIIIIIIIIIIEKLIILSSSLLESGSVFLLGQNSEDSCTIMN